MKQFKTALHVLRCLNNKTVEDIMGRLNKSGGMTVKELTVDTGMRQGNISQYLYFMRKNGLVHVENHPDDTRLNLYVVNKTALATFKKHISGIARAADKHSVIFIRS